MKKEVKENSKEIEEFAKKAIPILKEHGYAYESNDNENSENDDKNKRAWLYSISILIVGLAIVGVIYYSGWSGWWKSTISCPQVNVPECKFPEIPACPPQTCPTCPSTSCNFPQNLSIKLVNSTG